MTFRFNKKDRREIERLAKIDMKAAIKAALTFSRRYCQDKEGNWVTYDELERSRETQEELPSQKDARIQTLSREDNKV